MFVWSYIIVPPFPIVTTIIAIILRSEWVIKCTRTKMNFLCKDVNKFDMPILLICLGHPPTEVIREVDSSQKNQESTDFMRQRETFFFVNPWPRISKMNVTVTITHDTLWLEDMLAVERLITCGQIPPEHTISVTDWILAATFSSSQKHTNDLTPEEIQLLKTTSQKLLCQFASS